MRRLLPLIVLVLVVAGATMAFGRSPTAVPIPSETPRNTLNSVTGAVGFDCGLGNLNDPAFYVTDWLQGNEAYKLLFNPVLTNGCTCPYGFLINCVHIVLYFPAGSENCPISMWADLEDAAWNPARNCWAPGPQDCVSQPVEISVPAPGVYDIMLPLPCDCAYMDYWYLISVHFGPITCAVKPQIVVDAGPIFACTNWNDWGEGWQDLALLGWTWNLKMYADVGCCSAPVATERSTWGDIKSIYR